MAEEPEEPSAETPIPDQTTAFAEEGPTGGSTWRMGTQRGGNDATRLPEISAPLEVIGDFEVLGKLGQGGMGAVYRARQISLDRQVALKILPASLEADEEFVTRFQREARVAASLNHANLVTVYSSGLANGCHYIAMELVEGETLGQFVRRGPLPIPEALRICADVARALQCGWDRAQLIHRDIKPGNIFLSQNGEVKVGDLGLAKSMAGDTTGLTQTGTAMGTPHYISPEQARGDKDLDFRADIYSLGCTLFQMLTGRTPYEGRDPLSVMNMHINAPPPAILKVMPQCPIPLVRLVGKMLKKVKRERQGSYGDLIAEIERVQALYAPAASPLEHTLPPDPEATLAEPRKPPTVRPVTARAVAVPRAKSKRPLYGGIAVVVLGGLAAAFWPKGAGSPTKAELDARQRATAQTAATPAPDADSSSRIGAPVQAIRPDAMKLWNTADSVSGVEGAEWVDGVIHLTEGMGLYHTRARSRDVVFRASVRMNADARSPQLMIRQNDPEKGKAGTYYRLALNSGEKYVVLYRCLAWNHQQLDKWNLPAQYQTGDWLPLEIRAIGDEFQVSAGGKVLGSVRDDGLPEAGGVGIFANAEGYFRDVEYTPLDGATGSANPIAAPAWRNALDDPEFAKSIGSPGGMGITLSRQAIYLLPGSLRDGAIRARGRYSPEWRSFKLVARRSGRLFYQMELKDTYVMLHRVDGNQYTRLQNLRESSNVQTPAIGQPIEMEFRVVGSRFTGLIDGQAIVEAEDATISAGALGIGLGSRDESFSLDSVEFLDLDAPSTSQPAPRAAATESVSAWEPLISEASWRSTGEGREFKEGLLHMQQGGGHRKVENPDGAVRALFHLRPGSRDLVLKVRSAPGGACYRWTFDPPRGRIALIRGEPGTELARYNLPQSFPDGEKITLELRAVGTRISGLLNAKVVAEAQDDAFQSTGNMSVHATNGWCESVEYQVVTPGTAATTTTSARSTPATATKDAPFVNALGMKFVPVPITGGATNGQRVLFSIWETRVQDYERFATDTNRQILKPKFEQEPAHPVVNVSWEDARAMCEWLTLQARRDGSIGAQERYRLPSDHEWSCAVGIGDREDAAIPAWDKDRKVLKVYAWGSHWPPPQGVGNYADETAKQRRAKDGEGYLNGYEDSHPWTSPVGSFAPNPFGLFDLDGNVREWCDDIKTGGGDGNRGLRGGSWGLGTSDDLVLSRREITAMGARTHHHGFRVVLAPEATAGP